MRSVPSVLVVLALLAGSAPAQTPESTMVLDDLHVGRLVSPIILDGYLHEAAWQRPPTAARLVQSDPVEGAAPSESTHVWVAYDEDALYVAARLWDSCPDSIVAKLVRRDVSEVSDRLVVYLDPYNDHRSGYFFSVSAAGVLWDGLLYNDVGSDDLWDGVWDGRARRDDRGWTCEMRIPFSQLRYRAGADQVWGINLRRRIERRAELNELVYQPKNNSGFVSRFPHLVGLENGRRPRSLEVNPYLTAKAEYLVHEPGDPFNDGSRYTPGLGADLRTNVGNKLTLNVTVNPDFGQVEVDPAVVNLSDVESFFDEKRPFFTENSRIFRFGNEGAGSYWSINWPEPLFFYSRRIGRAPQGSVPSADFADLPVATHILGAGKLTGKLTPSLNFGTLHAVTRRETAQHEQAGLRSRTEVEPLSYYGLARGLKELGGGSSGLGLLTSLVQRRFEGAGPDAEMNRQSLMTGLDGWHFLDREKLWVLSGWAAMSRVAGTPEQMIALQQSSRHYLQRPDVDYLGVDSSATSLTGYGARLWLNKQRGNPIFNSAVGFMTPKFEVNDMGYQSYADVVNLHVGSGHRWTTPNRWRKQATVAIIGFQTFDFGGNRTSAGLYGDVWANFANDYFAEVELLPMPATLNHRRTRGGPLMEEKAGFWGHLHVDTDPKEKISFCINHELSLTPAAGSHAWSVIPTLSWKPVSNFSLSIGPGVEHVVEDAQYVTDTDGAGYVPADFGERRYVFARLDQRTLSANLRLNVSFTPNLSFQTYLQPLLSAGSYTEFKELARARSYEFIRYGLDNGSTYDPATGTVDPDGPGPAPAFEVDDPSFNYKSLRGNAVLRWEYRPGSTLFLVWTQSRSDSEEIGELRFRPSVTQLFDTQADNIFLAKVSYYLNL